MVRTPRYRRGLISVREGFVLVLVGSLGGSGCGKSSRTPASQVAALRMISQPVHYTQVNEEMRYQAATSKPGAVAWAMESGPAGASIDEGGNMKWTASSDQAGAQTFTVAATIDGETARQTFTVTAAASVMQAQAMVDPADPNGSTIAVDAPLSPMRGAAVQVEPGALAPGAPIGMTISSMEHAPVPPMAAAAGVSPSDLRPVELGPSGLAFRKPTRIQLPISAAVLAKGNPVVQTYDYPSGQWRRVKLLFVDRQNGIAVAEAQHFSTYVVTPDVKVIDLQVGLGGSGTACGDALLVRAPLAVGFSQIPATAINGYTGTKTTVADALGDLSVGQALQVLIRISARADAATGEQVGWVLGAATKQVDGKLKVSVTSDVHPGGFLTTPTALASTDPALESWLNGSRADFIFRSIGSTTGGAIAKAEVSLYVVPSVDADRPPPASANAFGTEEIVEAAPAALPGYDDDCDGAPNAWDPEPNGTAPPVVLGPPPGPRRVTVGNPVPFKVSSPQMETTFAWGASDPSIGLSSAMGGSVAIATPSAPGVFQVWVTATAGGASTRLIWDLVAQPASVQASTPPFVAIGASANVIRVGETVSLTAFAKDAEQASLTFVWSASDPATLSAGSGPNASFTATSPGDYQIGCVGNDGAGDSAPAHLTVSVVSATANRPPGVPSVSPMSAALQHDRGAMVSMMMKAQSTDPDGDTLGYDFVADPMTSPTFTLTKNGSNALFSTTQDGVYIFYVTAIDTHGAKSPWAPVKVQVLSTLPAIPVDADRDGYPAGFDCDDNDPRIFPGAKEICGDGVDQNCDGRDLAATECDNDGDRYSTVQGDCDDHNPAIGPAALERCDGIDNNCNGAVDEGFDVGVACLGGMGACQMNGKTVCGASYTAVVCSAAPGTPAAEVCDGVDNDCNGRVDDVPGQITGDAANCGGCGLACPVRDNAVATCASGGCVSTCAAGYVDADRDPANGCECHLTNGGVEACDGVDNDCNGVIDDGGGSTYYAGPTGTEGIGVCRAGAQACSRGQLTIAEPARGPTPEVCDGLDNDCNGKVDDGFNLLVDPKNCGACGLICPAGVACQMGKCGGNGMGSPDGGVIGGGDAGTGDGGGSGGVDAGMGSLAVCTGAMGPTCTDLGNDSTNCGACGRACPTGQPCMGGTCVASGIFCPAPKAACPDTADPTKLVCTDPMFDPGNCGGCAKRCPTGVPCQMGVCQGTTPITNCPATAPIACPSTAGGMICTDPKTDPANCGGCAKACPMGIACQMGVCGGAPCPAAAPNACPSPTGDICTNLSSDPKNCGMCGLACAAGLGCMMGACGGTAGSMCPAAAPNVCPGSQGPVCTNLLSDSSNCGNCGVICPATLPCQMAMCGGPVAGGAGIGVDGGTTMCPATAPYPCPGPAGLLCTDVMRDPGNCGMCGRICPAGTTCAAGVCMMGAMGCVAPLTGCPTGCTSLKDDAKNCGFCGNTCPDGSGCQAGTCTGTLTCVPPTMLCGDAAAGKMYCTDTSHDPGNCGGCGKTCPAGAICTDGTCQGGGGNYPGLAACPSASGASLCASLLNDPTNCGACGKVCPAALGCYGGACAAGPATAMCPPELKPCADPTGKMYCANPLYDPANCGLCGNVCPAGTACVNAMCVGGIAPDGGVATSTCPAALKPCADPTGNVYCANPFYDPGNCGFCGNVCPAGTVCMNATCISGIVADGGTGAGPSDAGAVFNGDAGVPPPTCPAAFFTCMGAAGQPVCTDLVNDPANCGGCGIVCPAGTGCMQKICR